MKFSEISIGMSATVTKTITAADVEDFARISTDTNPIHLNEEYAKNTPFKRRIAHGILVSSLISAALAGKLPGEGCVYLGQELKFTAPVFLGDTVTATVTVTAIREDKQIITLSTVCKNQDGKDVVVGTATVMHRV